MVHRSNATAPSYQPIRAGPHRPSCAGASKQACGMIIATTDAARLYNVDEWWIERRLLARKMIDSGEHRTAYLIARDAALPARDIYKTEQEFTAGWIALRFLNDPATAAQHF